uniref:Uncharacterized protein n=1 Tax=Anguilla anguilla TaxID=7936 RepID=A0A0E9PJG4_ANGAN
MVHKLNQLGVDAKKTNTQITIPHQVFPMTNSTLRT